MRRMHRRCPCRWCHTDKQNNHWMSDNSPTYPHHGCAKSMSTYYYYYDELLPNSLKRWLAMTLRTIAHSFDDSHYLTSHILVMTLRTNWLYRTAYILLFFSLNICNIRLRIFIFFYYNHLYWILITNGIRKNSCERYKFL